MQPEEPTKPIYESDEASASEAQSTKDAIDIPVIPDQGSADELFRVGDKLLSLGKLALAKEAFRRALAVNGNQVSTLGRLGDVCVRLKEYEEAIDYYDRIGTLVEVKPAWLYVGLANAYKFIEAKGICDCQSQAGIVPHAGLEGPPVKARCVGGDRELVASAIGRVSHSL